MGVFTNIEAALNTKLATLSGLPDVAWPNIDYTPKINTVFIRPTILPASGVLTTMLGGYEHKGLYQIDIFVSINKGIKTLTTLLDSIQVLFTTNKTLVAGTDLIYIQDVSLGKHNREDSWFCGNITIKYVCYS